MARGILSGAIWGTVISVGGLGVVSVLESNARSERDVLADAINELTRQEAEQTAAEPEVPTETPVEDQVEEATQPLAEDPEPETADVLDGQEADAEPDVTVAEAEPTVEPAQELEDASGQVADTPEPETVQVPSPETAQAPETTPESEDAGEDQATAVEQPVVEPARRPSDVADVTVDADAPDLNAPSQSADALPQETVSTPTPETGEAVADLQAPDTGAAPDVSVGTTQSAATTGNAPALAVPDAEVGLSVSTEPAQPPAPVVPQVETPLTPQPVESEVAETAPTPSDANAEAESTEVAAAEEPAPERPQVRRLVPDAPEADDAEDGAVTTAALARPTIGRPAGSLVDRNLGISRLPSIGGDTETDAADAPSTTAPGGGAPLTQFAADSAATEGAPRMAIVLIDDGTSPLGPDTLDTFPFAVTFAIDPLQSGAAARMAGYRAMGYEVAALVSVPVAAQPSDVEQILAGSVMAVPEAVALIEAPGAGLQSSRDVTEQATAFAAESGHGLVFMPNGLNTAAAIAARGNVPSVSVLRDFDGDNQDARTKRRFLDGAAFRARQDGEAVMLGRLTPDTVSALLLWSLQDRASSVAMVPVSAILKEQID